MDERKFALVAGIRTTDRVGIQVGLAEILPHGIITPMDEGFRVETVVEGTSARDLNRTLLSALRRIDRRATIHAAWTIDGITERFFDYTTRGTGSTQTSDWPPVSERSGDG